MGSIVPSATLHYVRPTPLDHLPPRNYVKLVLYIPLKPDAEPSDVYEDLLEALHRTFVQIPWLSGRVYGAQPDTPGYRPGQLEIRYHPVSPDGPRPRHLLRFKDWATTHPDVPSWDDLRGAGVPADGLGVLDEKALLPAVPLLADREQGSDAFAAQANFIPGACILAFTNCHGIHDGFAMVFMAKMWADHCRRLRNTAAAAMIPEPAPLAPDANDRALLDRLWLKETGGGRMPVKPDAWLRSLVGLEGSSATCPPNPLLSGWRPTRRNANYIFYISADKLAALKAECSSKHEVAESDSSGSDNDEEAGGNVSAADAISALLWRSHLKARKAAGVIPLVSDESVLELPYDGRGDFSPDLPPVYLSNMWFMNTARLPLAELTSPQTPLARVARAIRAAAGRISPQALRDAYALLREAASFDDVRPRFFGVEGADLCISNLVLFPTDEIAFGGMDKKGEGHWFANGGRAQAVRCFQGRWDDWSRLAHILPRKKHGGVEISVHLLDEERDEILRDEEFTRYFLPVFLRGDIGW